MYCVYYDDFHRNDSRWVYTVRPLLGQREYGGEECECERPGNPNRESPPLEMTRQGKLVGFTECLEMVHVSDLMPPSLPKVSLVRLEGEGRSYTVHDNFSSVEDV